MNIDIRMSGLNSSFNERRLFLYPRYRYLLSFIYAIFFHFRQTGHMPSWIMFLKKITLLYMKDIFSNHSSKGLQKQLIGLVNYYQKEQLN